MQQAEFSSLPMTFNVISSARTELVRVRDLEAGGAKSCGKGVRAGTLAKYGWCRTLSAAAPIGNPHAGDGGSIHESEPPTSHFELPETLGSR